MEIKISSCQDIREYDQNLTALLFEVFVDEGFTDQASAENAFAAEAVRSRGEVFAARSDHETLGMVVLVQPQSSFRQIAKIDEAEIHLLAVKASARKMGIASALIRACEERAASLGYSAIVLSTQPSMIAAQQLYKQLGFARNEDRDWSNSQGKRYLAFEKRLVLRL